MVPTALPIAAALIALTGTVAIAGLAARGGESPKSRSGQDASLQVVEGTLRGAAERSMPVDARSVGVESPTAADELPANDDFRAIVMAGLGGGSSPACCPGDIDCDGDIDPSDLALLLGDWGLCFGCGGDINSDGAVDGTDLAILLGAWGPCFN